MKYLGVIIDQNLSWKQQVERVRQKSLAGLAVIRRASANLPLYVRTEPAVENKSLKQAVCSHPFRKITLHMHILSEVSQLNIYVTGCTVVWCKELVARPYTACAL